MSNPQQGYITASCGHKLTSEDEGEEVIYSGESCDAVDGFQPCVSYAWFCSPCAREARGWPEYLPSHEAADAWMATTKRTTNLAGYRRKPMNPENPLRGDS